MKNSYSYASSVFSGLLMVARAKEVIGEAGAVRIFY
jgi:hypothetical protein